MGPDDDGVRIERGGVEPMADDHSSEINGASPTHGGVDAETAAEEQRESRVRSGADRDPTDEESALADRLADRGPDPDVAEHEREMARRGADVQGEGRIE
jgi:hypothetical protein